MKPSSWSLRWLKCNASVRLELPYTRVLTTHEQIEHDVMAVLHGYFELGEALLKSRLNQMQANNELYRNDEGLIEKCRAVINYVEGKYADIEHTVSVHCELEHEFIALKGYINVATDNLNEVIRYSNHYVNDFRVNDPRMILSLFIASEGSSVSDPDIELQVMTIIHPNVNVPSSTQFIPHQTMLNQANNLIEKAKNLDNTLHFNEHCATCLHYQNCDEVVRHLTGEIMQHELIISKVHEEIDTMSDQELCEILTVESVFNDAFSRAKVEATRRISEEGRVLNGWHLTKGKKSKVWKVEEEEIAKQMRTFRVVKAEVYPSKLITPAQALKLELSDRQKETLAELIDIKEGHPILKPNAMSVEFDQISTEPEVPATPEPMSFL